MAVFRTVLSFPSTFNAQFLPKQSSICEPHLGQIQIVFIACSLIYEDIYIREKMLELLDVVGPGQSYI